MEFHICKRKIFNPDIFQNFENRCLFFLLHFSFLQELFKYPVSVLPFSLYFSYGWSCEIKISSNIYMYINMNGGMKVNKIAFCM